MNYKISLFKITCEKNNSLKLNWSIRGNIFVSGKHTNIIQNIIEKENWGAHQHQLYHYLDYTFRTRVMKNQVKVYIYNNGCKIAVFHTGLKERNTLKPMYLVCKPNTHAKKNPKWAVSTDNIHNVGEWFMTKESLMYKYGINENDLPRKIEYINNKYSNKYYFNNNYKCKFDWDLIFTNLLTSKAKKTILKTIKQNGCKIESRNIKERLTIPFTNAVNNTLSKLKISDNYAKPGLFIDFDRQNYWVDLMMYIKVYYENRYHSFVIILKPNEYLNRYEFKDLLSLKQGYYNGRYIQKLADFWKPKQVKSFKDNNNNNRYNYHNNNNNHYNNHYNNHIQYNKDTLSPSPTLSSTESATDSLSTSNTTEFSLDDTKSEESKAELNNINYNNNNNNNSIFDNNNVENKFDKFACQSSNYSYFNSLTGQIETINITKFTDNAMKLCTELITVKPSNKYTQRTYSLIDNSVLSEITGNINELISFN